MMARLVALDSGEAFLFAPSGIMMSQRREIFEQAMESLETGGQNVTEDDDDEEGVVDVKRLEKFGLRYMKVKIRKRITQDGGRSVMAVS